MKDKKRKRERERVCVCGKGGCRYIYIYFFWGGWKETIDWTMESVQKEAQFLSEPGLGN